MLLVGTPHTPLQWQSHRALRGERFYERVLLFYAGVQRLQPITNSADGLVISAVDLFYTNYVIHIRGYTHSSYNKLKEMETSLFSRLGCSKNKVKSNISTTNSAHPRRLSQFSAGLSGHRPTRGCVSCRQSVLPQFKPSSISFIKITNPRQPKAAKWSWTGPRQIPKYSFGTLLN